MCGDYFKLFIQRQFPVRSNIYYLTSDMRSQKSSFIRYYHRRIMTVNFLQPVNSFSGLFEDAGIFSPDVCYNVSVFFKKLDSNPSTWIREINILYILRKILNSAFNFFTIPGNPVLSFSLDRKSVV